MLWEKTRYILFCFILFLAPAVSVASLRADINVDCRVDMLGLAILVSEWMQEDEDCTRLGPELVTNGGFDTADEWVMSSTTISGGKLNFVGALGFARQIGRSFVTGNKYKASYEISDYISGSMAIDVANTLGTVVSDNGNYEEIIVAGESDEVLWVRGNGELKIDNVSVREILSAGSNKSGSEMLLLL